MNSGPRSSHNLNSQYKLVEFIPLHSDTDLCINNTYSVPAWAPCQQNLPLFPSHSGLRQMWCCDTVIDHHRKSPDIGGTLRMKSLGVLEEVKSASQRNICAKFRIKDVRSQVYISSSWVLGGRRKKCFSSGFQSTGPDQQHQHHQWTCEKCKFSGPTKHS